MNNINKKVLFGLMFLVFYSCKINTGAFVDIITKGIEQPKMVEFAIGEVGKAEQQLKELKENLAKIKEKDQEFEDRTNKKIEDFTNDIRKTNQQITNSPENLSFLEAKLKILNEMYQDIQEMQISRRQSFLNIEEHIKVLEGYIQDPNFQNLLKELIDQKKFYSFDDLQKINEYILSEEDKIKLLEEQKQNIQVEIDSKEQVEDATIESYDKKVKELENFKKNPNKSRPQSKTFEFSRDQKFELLILQESYLKNKKDLNKAKIKEIKYKLELTKTNLFVENSKLNTLKKTANDIKQTIQISETDILNDNTELEKQNTENIKNTLKYKSEIDRVLRKYETDKKDFDKTSKEYKIKTPMLEQWEISPITKNDYIQAASIGRLNEDLSLLLKEKEFYEAQIIKGDNDLSQLKLNVETKESFYKIETKKFASEKDIQNEIKKYNNIKSGIKANLAATRDKINIAKDNLKTKNKATENILKIRAKINKINQERPLPVIGDIDLAETKIKQQIKYLQDTIDIYENIISVNNRMEKQATFILSVLEQLVGKWYRPEYAIKFEKIPTIIPDLKAFFYDLFSYFKKFNIIDFFENTKKAINQKTDFINLLFLLVLFFVFIIIFRAIANRIKNHILGSKKKNTMLEKPDNLLKFFSYSLAFLLDFSSKYLLSMSIWTSIFFLLKIGVFPDRYITIIFYLASIAYLSYLTNRFFKHFREFSKKYNLLTFIEPSYQKRIIAVISVIIYSTILIQFFRKAFELDIYYQSELPTILSALNWIIGQIALILLVTKELVRKIITKNWNLSPENFNKFYYFILVVTIIIIVMANPYIGLGRLLLYIIQRILLSMILLIGLLMLHKIGKNLSLKLFFKTDDETILTRFTYGKTIYGIYIISSFFIIILFGILIGSYIWNLGISLESINNVLNKKILIEKMGELSALSVIIIVSFVILGFIFSALFNKYVLTKIFNLLLVETGVQFTVSTMLKYLFIAIFTIIGFSVAELENLIVYLLMVMLVALGFIIYEPSKDFIYYFLILISRPLKIGDYVRIKTDSMDLDGVVRRITPRSVIIKSRNSEAIEIPNSAILSGPIINFNHNTRFIAFDDIKLTVGFKHDPEMVRKIIIEVMDAHPNILKSPKPIIRLEDFGDNGFIFSIRGFLSAQYTLDMWDISSDVRIKVAKALKANNIEIAIPISIWKSVD